VIPPQSQWCHQICVTSACWPKPACSNCTRLLGHEPTRYYMSPEQFESVVKVAAPFIKHSYDDVGQLVNRQGTSQPAAKRKKVLGIFGGEPLMHPKFPELVDILNYYVPDKANRGLWTSFDWANGESKVWGRYRDQVERLLGKNPNGSVFSYESGYLNWNMHEETQPCEHSPVLAASQDLVKDEKKRWELISKCWVQTEWSAAYALNYYNEPKFYFCEVASAFDRVFNLGTGLDIEPGVWSHHLWFEEDERGIKKPQGLYAKQILSTCNRCGSCLKLPGRRDREFRDDISESNFVALTSLGSPMVKRGQYVKADSNCYEANQETTASEIPWEYQKDNRQQQMENFRKAREHNG